MKYQSKIARQIKFKQVLVSIFFALGFFITLGTVICSIIFISLFIQDNSLKVLGIIGISCISVFCSFPVIFLILFFYSVLHTCREFYFRKHVIVIGEFFKSYMLFIDDEFFDECRQSKYTGNPLLEVYLDDYKIVVDPKNKTYTINNKIEKYK